jgi:WD repeat-containing protein 61
MFEVQNKISGVESEFWCFSWKNNRIVTGSLDGIIRVWDNDLVLLKQWNVSPLGLISLATNGVDVASSSMDGKLKIWNIETGELKDGQSKTIGCGDLWQVKWQPSSSAIAYSSSGKIERVDIKDLENPLSEFAGTSSAFITSLAFSADGKYIASGNKDGVISIFDVIGGNEVAYIADAHNTPIRCLAFSYNNTILSGADDKSVNIFDCVTGKKLGSLVGHSGLVSGISCSPNGAHIATCSSDKTIKIWSTADKSCLNTLHHHTAPVVALEWSMLGDYLVSISHDQSIISYRCVSK